MRSVIFIRKISKYQVSAKMSISVFPHTKYRHMLSHISRIEIGRYGIVDDGGNYAMFHELNIRIKIKNKIIPHNASLGRLCSSARLICLLPARPSF